MVPFQGSIPYPAPAHGPTNKQTNLCGEIPLDAYLRILWRTYILLTINHFCILLKFRSAEFSIPFFPLFRPASSCSRGDAWGYAALRAAGATHRCAVLEQRCRHAAPRAARLRSIAIGRNRLGRAFLLRRLTHRTQRNAKPFPRREANADKATFGLSRPWTFRQSKQRFCCAG